MSFTVRRIAANKIFLYLLSALALSWFALIAWQLSQPPVSWANALVIAVFVFCFFRLLFEITLNHAKIPTMASNMAARKKIADLIQKDRREKMDGSYSVLDLGSGRGELARRIAKSNPDAFVTGIEIARLPFLESRLLQKIMGPSNLSFKNEDFWTFDCASIDAIVLYVGPLTSERVGAKLKKEMKKGALIISNTYPLSGAWVVEEEISFRSPFKEKLYVYHQS